MIADQMRTALEILTSASMMEREVLTLALWMTQQENHMLDHRDMSMKKFQHKYSATVLDFVAYYKFLLWI